MHNPYVLIRPYGHLTIVALIGLHQIMWVSHITQSISISIVGFGDCIYLQNGYPYEPSETNIATARRQKFLDTIWRETLAGGNVDELTRFKYLVKESLAN